jgi:maltooligosyltrehalose trehalohydrolase
MQIQPRPALPEPKPVRSPVTFVYDPDGVPVDDVQLVGSWTPEPQPMHLGQDGRWRAHIETAWDPTQKYQWSVHGDGAPLTFKNLEFSPNRQPQTLSYSARQLSRMGVSEQEGDAVARFWAPQARAVHLVVQDGPKLALRRDAEGFWNRRMPEQWSKLEGKSYAFQVTSAEGNVSVRADPYARRLQGQLRGVSELYLDPATGQEVNKFSKAAQQFWRFEVQQQPDAAAVYLRLFDKEGRALDRDALENKLGSHGQALVERFDPGLSWRGACQSDGRIALKKCGRDAWSTVADARLQGLSYRFEVVQQDGTLSGDQDGNRELCADEAKHTPFNDPYNPQLQAINDQRWGVVSKAEYNWKHEPPSLDPRRAVTYQLHVGSFLGEAKNTRRSTFQDLTEKLDYFRELGVTHLELLPTSPFEGLRDWGYIGSSSMAAAEQYGFVDHDGRWVDGAEALKRFIDEAHGRGLSVIGDVVYNHWGGDFNNMWEVDGKQNSYFNWGNGLRETPWGPMPAYNQPAVRQLVIDHAMAQLDEFRFDGLRFDFTHPIHAQDGGGGDHGWSMLREITAQARARHPQVFLAAEEFPNHPVVTSPVAQGGAGFDAMWNTEFQHRLAHDNHNPSIVQQAVAGQQTNVDQFMRHLVNHPGFADPMESVTVISNHDEVGNADRTINVTRGGALQQPPDGWQRGLARLTFGVGMFSPGRPIFFQGDETLAENRFKWGVPSTWDTEAPHVPPEQREQHFEFCKAAIRLRRELPALAGGVPAQRVYTHNDDSVFAFSRKAEGEELLVVASLARQERRDYAIAAAQGAWELVLSSDDVRFGGSGTAKPQVQAKTFHLPAGGVLVYRRVKGAEDDELLRGGGI